MMDDSFIFIFEDIYLHDYINNLWVFASKISQ